MQKSGPKTVGIIMDGNRRWARARGLGSAAGHEAGKNALLSLVRAYGDLKKEWGTEHYIFYGFSTENWNRADEEVAALLGVFERAFADFEKELPLLRENNIRIRFVGERRRFSKKLQELMETLEEKTHTGTGTIAIALSYGGHVDILQAAHAAFAEGERVLTKETLEKRLWTASIPMPDLIVRPGGERRLSNFLTWQSAYSELAFSDTLWPDFTAHELGSVFADFALRSRRHGT